jgi:hypothetical protein
MDAKYVPPIRGPRRLLRPLQDSDIDQLPLAQNQVIQRRGPMHLLPPLKDSDIHQLLPLPQNRLQQLHEYASVKEPEKNSPMRLPHGAVDMLEDGLAFPPPLPHERRPPPPYSQHSEERLPHQLQHRGSPPSYSQHLEEELPPPLPHERRPPPYSQHLEEALPPPLPHERSAPLDNPQSSKNPLTHDDMTQSIDIFFQNIDRIIRRRTTYMGGRYVLLVQYVREDLEREKDSFNRFLDQYTDIPEAILRSINERLQKYNDKYGL